MQKIAAPAKRLLRPTAVEEFYDIAVGYQAKMRCSGDGPEFIKIGSRVYYKEEAIEQWLATKRRTSTSDPGTPNQEDRVEGQGSQAPSVRAKPAPQHVRA
jgi:hypothetical protein